MPATEVIMPKVDMDMESGTVAAWHVAEGELVKAGAPLFDIETDKAAMEVEAPASGRLAKVTAAPGDVVAIGQPLAWICPEEQQAPLRVNPASKPDDAPAAAKGANSDKGQTGGGRSPSAPINSSAEINGQFRAPASPLARRIARENGIDLRAVEGSGPRGRIMRRDIEAHSRAATPVAPDGAGHPDVAFRAVPVDRMRATIARRLTESKSTVPHFYLDMDCRLDALLKVRTELNQAAAMRSKPRISLNDLILKASALALEAVPEANASWAGDVIHRYRTTDISMAVALDDGLVTPVLRDVAGRAIGDLAIATTELADLARAGRLPPDAYRGGSLTVSNLGMFGIKSFCAIINPPQSMILAVGESERRLIPDKNDRPLVVTFLPVTLSCDHRVVDGAVGARWLQHFRSAIEHPMGLLL